LSRIDTFACLYKILLKPYYDEHGAEYFAESLQAELGEVRRRFTALLAPGAEVCDGGCGSGRDARIFLDQGYRVTAFDASAALVALARVHTGLPVLHLAFQDLDFERAFDGLWTCASLLHVPRAGERDVIDRCARALRPGGIWYLCYRVGRGECLDGPRFFRYHTEETLRALLRQQGDLEVLEVWETPDRRPGHPEVWLNVLARRRVRGGGGP
jgi:SAM-dependent methyltransferase